MGGVDIRGSATGTEEIATLDPGHVTPDRSTPSCSPAAAPSGWRPPPACAAIWKARASASRPARPWCPSCPPPSSTTSAIGKANVRPTREMGEAAAAAATGERGRGRLRGRGHRRHGGQTLRHEAGHESRHRLVHGRAAGGVLVSALVAVNALRRRARPGHRQDCRRARATPGSREFADSNQLRCSAPAPAAPASNTTLAVVATNARLTKVQATKLAQLASLGMARTIYPVNTMFDGDIVFAFAPAEKSADINALGVAAAEAVAQAILRAVRLAPTLGGVPGLAG